MYSVRWDRLRKQNGDELLPAAFVELDGSTISAWNDVPYSASAIHGSDDDDVLNFVCEVPAHTVAKMEIQTTMMPHTPIMQDSCVDDCTGLSQLRNYRYAPIPCNYGAVPQTWEDPLRICSHTHVGGDGDPLDVLEIGSGPLPTGTVTPVKVLGALAMIDNNETDWKIIAVRMTDELALFANDIEDVHRYRPQMLSALRKWLAEYKVAEGKPLNRFAFDGKYQPRSRALEIVRECHCDWEAGMRNGRLHRYSKL